MILLQVNVEYLSQVITKMDIQKMISTKVALQYIFYSWRHHWHCLDTDFAEGFQPTLRAVQSGVSGGWQYDPKHKWFAGVLSLLSTVQHGQTQVTCWGVDDVKIWLVALSLSIATPPSLFMVDLSKDYGIVWLIYYLFRDSYSKLLYL